MPTPGLEARALVAERTPPSGTEAWDNNAAFRAAEIDNDTAYAALTSAICHQVENLLPSGSRILDAGCGVGRLTSALVGLGYKVVGIDPSPSSIAHASTLAPAPLSFDARSIEDYASDEAEPFDAVVANMVLHTVDDLEAFLDAAHRLLAPCGVLLASIPHPRGYLPEKGGDPSTNAAYHEEGSYWLRFRISGQNSHPALVPYTHRRISTYLNALLDAGFQIDRMEEPTKVGGSRPSDIMFIRARVAAP